MIEDAYDLREKISDYESLGLTRICDEYLYGDRKTMHERSKGR